MSSIKRRKLWHASALEFQCGPRVPDGDMMGFSDLLRVKGFVPQSLIVVDIVGFV